MYPHSRETEGYGGTNVYEYVSLETFKAVIHKSFTNVATVLLLIIVKCLLVTLSLYWQEEAEARQLGIELLKPGDRAELVLGTNRKEEQVDHQQLEQQQKPLEDLTKAEDTTDGRIQTNFGSNPFQFYSKTRLSHNLFQVIHFFNNDGNDGKNWSSKISLDCPFKEYITVSFFISLSQCTEV